MTKELATSRDKKTAAAPKFQSTLTAMAGLSYTQKQLLNNHAYAQLKASQQNYFQKPIESKDRRMKDPQDMKSLKKNSSNGNMYSSRNSHGQRSKERVVDPSFVNQAKYDK